MEDGTWALPILFGVDSDSEAAATAYAIDHNNLTLAGSDLTFLDAARMWNEEGYLALLESLETEAVYPVTLTSDDLHFLVTGLDTLTLPDLTQEAEVEDPAGRSSFIRVRVGNTVIYDQVVAGLARFLETQSEWAAKIIT